MKITSLIKNTLWCIGLPLIMHSCYFESHKVQDNQERVPPTKDKSSQYENSGDTYLIADSTFENHYYENSSSCRKDYEYYEKTYQTPVSQCSQLSCKNLSIKTHTLIDPYKGYGKQLTVEVYDNPYFHGIPIHQDIIPDFKTSSIGEVSILNIHLPKGKYYARAFLSEASMTLPSSLQGMVPDENAAIAVNGAISNPHAFEITGDSCSKQSSLSPQQTVDLYLNRLYKDPSIGPQTDAFILTNIKASNPQQVTRFQTIHVLLMDEDNINKTPAYRYEFPSEQMLIEGSAGQTQFLTEELDSGFYYVYVFVDANMNQRYDQGELIGTKVSAEGDGIPVHVMPNETQVIDLTLIN